MRNVLGPIAAAVLAFAPGVSAAPADVASGPPRGTASRVFDPATVTTVSGDVVAIHNFDARRGRGVHVDLKTADGTVLDVHLGPSSFLARRHLKVARGDALEVTGSRVEFVRKPALIAQSVKKGDVTVTLRDTGGIPAWSGGARR